MNNSVFVKIMENVRKHRGIKFVTTNRRSCQVAEPNYHATKWFSENQKMDKSMYLGLLILDISKIAMYECWYDFIKPKYGNKPKLCYTDTGSLIVDIKSEDIHADLARDIEKRFDTSNYKSTDHHL